MRSRADVGGYNVASLIEQAGLKGASVRKAAVSERDCCCIVANPGATSDDVVELIELVKRGVQDQLGIDLETQIQIW